MADIQLIRGSNGNGPAVRPVVTATRSSGSLTIKVNNTTNLPPSFIGTWGKLNPDTGKLISSSIRDFYGTVNGADIDLVRMADGFTDDGNEEGDVIIIKPNTDWANNLADALLVSHKPDGTHKPDSILSLVYPVGSLYFNATNGTNPASLLGFGTWVAFGAGRVPVGFDSSQTEFNSAGKTGGAKTHSLTAAQNGQHTHGGSIGNGGVHNHGIKVLSGSGNGFEPVSGRGGMQTGYIDGDGLHSHSLTINNSGNGSPHNNLQPYITVYIWRRTA